MAVVFFVQRKMAVVIFCSKKNGCCNFLFKEKWLFVFFVQRKMAVVIFLFKETWLLYFLFKEKWLL